jgi:hypothetical protein
MKKYLYVYIYCILKNNEHSQDVGLYKFHSINSSQD